MMANYHINKWVDGATLKIVKLKAKEIDENPEKLLSHYLQGNLILLEDFRIPVDLNQFEFHSLEPYAEHNNEDDLGVQNQNLWDYKKPSAKKIALKNYCLKQVQLLKNVEKSTILAGVILLKKQELPLQF